VSVATPPASWPIPGSWNPILGQSWHLERFLSWYTPVWRHRTVVGLLFLIIFLTYRPALEQPPRQDQWAYLLDTVHEDRLLPLLTQTYSYNRTRVVGAGDYPLFRPVLFAILSVEKALFGQRHTLSQGVGITLHCAVVWVFLRILLQLHRSFPTEQVLVERLRLALAYALPLFFAVNLIGSEMVSWAHIHGYALYVLLIISGWWVLLDDVNGVAQSRGWWWRHLGVFGLTLLAAFTYETGAAYAVCLGGILALAYACRGQLSRALVAFGLFAAILPLFLTVDWLDRWYHPNLRHDISHATVWEQARWQPTSEHARRYLLFTLGLPFFPSCPHWSFNDRLYIPEPGAELRAYQHLKPAVVLSYAVVLGGVGLAVVQLGRMLVDRKGISGSLFLLLPVSLILLNMTIIVLGRMNLRPGPTALARQSYYAYPTFLSFLVVLYYLWVRLPPFSARVSSITLSVVLAGLGVLLVVSATRVHSMNDKIRSDYRDLHQQITFLNKMIDRHHQEPGFAFAFDPDLLYILPQYYGMPGLEILFAKSIDYEHPTYIVALEDNRWSVQSVADYERLHGGPRYREVATLVQPGDIMVYRYQQRFYGLRWQEGRLRTDRTDYARLLEGDSADEILSSAGR
jgi:hypothetical protein